MAEGVKADGTADYSIKRLEVSRELDVSEYPRLRYERSRVFWHEFFHACFFEMGCDDYKFWNIDIEHALINPLSKIFAHNFPIDL